MILKKKRTWNVSYSLANYLPFTAHIALDPQVQGLAWKLRSFPGERWHEPLYSDDKEGPEIETEHSRLGEKV